MLLNLHCKLPSLYLSIPKKYVHVHVGLAFNASWAELIQKCYAIDNVNISSAVNVYVGLHVGYLSRIYIVANMYIYM